VFVTERPESVKVKTTMLSLEQAQEKFNELVKRQQVRSLWFMRPDIAADVRDPQAGMILDKIAQHSPRCVWLETRQLKKWRSQNIK